MSTTKKTSTKGIRYSEVQKKEVMDFALNYNSTHGRGGQSKAAEKFNVSPLTVASWLKSAGAPSSKAAKKTANGAKPAKAAKAPNGVKVPKARKAAGKSKAGSRYSDEQKKELVDFVTAYNEEKGRGGASQASKKFGVSPLTVVAWLKAAGPNGVGKVAKKGVRGVAALAKAGGNLSAKLNSLLQVSAQIDKAEKELASLQAKFSSLKASL